MLRELLLRDLSLHRRILLTAAASPLIIALSAMVIPGPEAREATFAVSLMAGLVLVSLVPVTLHFRERKLGTLGDLMALPVHRRDLVRLRFLEGALAVAALGVAAALGWGLLRREEVLHVAAFFGSPVPLWILAVCMGYPLPFALRWGAKGLVAAWGLAMTVAYGGGAILFYGLPGRGLLCAAWDLVLQLRALGRPMIHLLNYGTPLLALGLFYLLSRWAMDRVDA